MAIRSAAPAVAHFKQYFRLLSIDTPQFLQEIGMLSTHADECDAETDPEEWFGEFRETVSILQDEFQDANVSELLKRADRAIDNAIESINEERWEPEEPDYEDISSTPHEQSSRSVFDDTTID